MSRFYEQNIDVILEMDALNKHIKDLRQYYELEHIFVVSTPAARERGIQSILETAGYTVTMWGEQYGDLTEPTNDQILEAYKEFAHSDADCVFAIGGGSIVDLDPQKAFEAINITSYGGFLVSQQSAKRMLKKKRGSIFFTGATASIKGFPESSVFAMGKFGLRGLAQSLARELHPQNIHIGHFIIDGGIGKENYGSYKTIHPDEIAKVYLQFHNQDKSAWSWETQLRTSVEKF